MENTTPTENMVEDEAARYARVSVSSLQRWRGQGFGPKFVKAGRRVIYRRKDLDDWMAQRTFQSTSEADANAA